MERQGPERREPDLSALADRLSGDASRGGPTLPYEITARGTGRRLGAIGAAGAFALVTLWQSDRLPFQVVPDGVPAFLPFLGLVLVLAFLPRAVRTRARAVVDAHGILVDGVPGVPGERHGWHRPWTALAQVGWFPDADGRGAILALRPPAPAAPVIATLPAHGKDAQGEAGDVIGRACAAHGVPFTHDPAAFDLDRGVRRAWRRLSE